MNGEVRAQNSCTCQMMRKHTALPEQDWKLAWKRQRWSTETGEGPRRQQQYRYVAGDSKCQRLQRQEQASCVRPHFHICLIHFMLTSISATKTLDSEGAPLSCCNILQITTTTRGCHQMTNKNKLLSFSTHMVIHLSFFLWWGQSLPWSTCVYVCSLHDSMFYFDINPVLYNNKSPWT